MMDSGDTMSTVRAKLVNVMGEQRGLEFLDSMLAKLDLHELRGPDDGVRLGNAMIELGGVFASVGRSIKIQAILRGATLR